MHHTYKKQDTREAVRAGKSLRKGRGLKTKF